MLWSIPPFASSVAMTYFTIAGDSTTLGIPHVNLTSLCAILGLGLVLHGVALLWRRCYGSRDAEVTEEAVNDEVKPLLRVN